MVMYSGVVHQLYSGRVTVGGVHVHIFVQMVNVVFLEVWRFFDAEMDQCSGESSFAHLSTCNGLSLGLRRRIFTSLFLVKIFST